MQTGDNAIIAGLILGGNNPVNVLLRVTGPSLKNYGIANALLDPILELHDSNGNTITDDNWRTAPSGASQEAEILATGLAPSDDREPAIRMTLVPGNYTAIARGVGNTTGVAVVEAYRLQ